MKIRSLVLSNELELTYTDAVFQDARNTATVCWY